MEHSKIIEWLEREYPTEYGGEGFILYDDIDDAFVGVAERFGIEPVALYDMDKCMDIYISTGMSREDAEEHFSFNVIGGWVGDGTPIFMRFMESDDG